jgi:exodeoxyribonuclease VII large subunit
MIAIIRGGGGKMDLGHFDNYDLCEYIAQSPLPVITGIGHDIDETVTDLVSHTSLKTPTAVAEFIVAQNAAFEADVLHIVRQIQKMAVWQIQYHRENLVHLSRDINMAAKTYIQQKLFSLDQIDMNIKSQAKSLVEKQHSILNSFERLSKALDPENVLKRGYAMALKDKKIVSSGLNLNPGDNLQIKFSDSTVKTKVTK